MSYPGRKIIPSKERAEVLARPFRAIDANGNPQTPDDDPFDNQDMNYAGMLSSDGIKKYVEETGMIYPFYVIEDEDKSDSLLKHASYEGRIGDKAYMFNEKGKLENLIKSDSKTLKLPGDSIVFVESDLEFRLPPFIALRFNLQIKHIHRGLLLGTGPIVDPGYWGKLCIPIHNLTGQDYEIELDDGLFWVEFTRIAYNPQDAVGRTPLSNKEHWDIKEFIEKVAHNKYGARISIQSYISKAAQTANANLEAVRKETQRAQSWSRAVSAISLLTLLGSIYAVWGVYWTIFSEYQSNTDQQIIELKMQIEELQSASNKPPPPAKEVPSEKGQQTGNSPDGEASKPDADASSSGDADLSKKNPASSGNPPTQNPP